MPRLVVLTPSLGKVSIFREGAVALLTQELERRGFDFRPLDDIWHNTMPGALFHARNCLLYRVAEELEDDDWAWWWDGDVSCHPRLIFDLMWRDEPVIAKGYPLKPADDGTIGWSAFPLRVKRDDGKYHVIPSEDRRLIEARAFGFGAVMMRPAVARHMRDLCGVRGMGGKSQRSIPAFDFLDDVTGNTCPEDTSFAIRYREQLSEKLGAPQRMWIAPDGEMQNGSVFGEFWTAVRQGWGG